MKEHNSYWTQITGCHNKRREEELVNVVFPAMYKFTLKQSGVL
jgi:hypothetical protein